MLLNDIKKKTELPYERFEKYGCEALTDIELLAILLRVGTKDLSVLDLSYQILSIADEEPDLSNIINVNIEQLIKLKGIGKIRAIQILAIVELSKRLWKSTRVKNNCLNTPEAVANYYMQQMRCLNKEELRLALLDTKQMLKKDLLISRGTINSSIISTRDILIEAMKYEAVNIVIVHNHPSGNPQPSNEDINVTKMLEKSCSLVGIHLNDHVIIGDNKYYSFKEQGVI